MKAVVLIGHGGVPTDFPPERVGRLRSLEAARQRAGGPLSQEEEQLDHEIRNWPRTPATEPFFYGLQAIADGVRKNIGDTKLEVAFNEFCGPSIEEACARLIKEGFDEIVLLSTMVTRGGIHSEFEIPEIIEKLQVQYPSVHFNYRWPYNLDEVGAFFAAQLS